MSFLLRAGSILSATAWPFERAPLASSQAPRGTHWTFCGRLDPRLGSGSAVPGLGQELVQGGHVLGAGRPHAWVSLFASAQLAVLFEGADRLPRQRPERARRPQPSAVLRRSPGVAATAFRCVYARIVARAPPDGFVRPNLRALIPDRAAEVAEARRMRLWQDRCLLVLKSGPR